MLRDPLAVGTALNLRYPVLVVQIPLHGLTYARLKGLSGAPAQCAFYFLCVDGIASVVTRSIGYVADLAGIRGAIRAWSQGIQERADGSHNLNIGLFVPPANVVRLAQLALSEYGANRTAMVADLEPVAYLHSVAENG